MEARMPSLSFSAEPASRLEAGTLAVFASRTGEGRAAYAVPTADAASVAGDLRIDLAEELAAIRFDGALGSVARIPTRGRAGAGIVLVVGLGPIARVDLEVLRKAAGAAARNALKDAPLAVVVPRDVPAQAPEGDAARAQAVVEGAGLGAYAYTAYRAKTADVPSLPGIVVVAGEGLDRADAEEGTRIGEVVVRATVLARDLVNTPPAAKRPPALARQVVAVAGDCGLRASVLDERALADGGFGGILGVGCGSSEPPRLVELTYDPAGAPSGGTTGAGGHVVLVGKGITFDSGGLSLKPTSAMAGMKSDMSGAAAIVGAMSACRSLGVATKVTGLLALAENMPSGHATRVSDVLVHRGGTTVEVMNTDAEGRLVLADALAYGAELGPDAMIDLATLTGAQIIALGTEIAALMGTDERLIEELRTAAQAAGERVWQLPLPEDYAEHLKSEVADLKNVGKDRQAGTIVAALYLKEFTGGVPWAHLDIAGPAFSDDGDGFYTPKGGTGMGVRTLLRFLRTRGCARLGVSAVAPGGVSAVEPGGVSAVEPG
jgi:leucyl aminopeptidase